MTRAVFARVFDRKTEKGTRDPAKCSLTPLNPAKNRRKPRRKSKNPVISDWVCELIAGIEPANLILTKDALYLLSYISIWCVASSGNKYILTQIVEKSKR